MRHVALAGAVVAILVAFFVVRPQSTPGPVMRDFESYWAAGSAWAAGDDPYSRQIWRAERLVPGVDASREELLPFVGPPFGLPLWAQLARLDYARAALIWSVVLAVAFLILTLGSLRLASDDASSESIIGERITDRRSIRNGGEGIDGFDRLAVLVLAAGFGPLTSGLALGQVAVVACAGTIVALGALRGRNALGAAAGALVAALQPNIALALGARFGDRRATIALALAAFVALVGSYFAAGGGAGLLRYVMMLREHAQAERFLAIQTTPAAIARAFGASPQLAGGIGLGLTALVLLWLAVQLTTRGYGALERFAIASAALPLAWPFAHEHDFALLFFPAVFALRRSGGVLALVAATVGTLLVAVNWLGLAQRPEARIQTIALTAAAAFAIVILTRRLPWPALGLGACAIAAIVILGSLAATHPLPIWPDALPANFRVDHAASVTAVWAAEQHASGIDGVDPLSGALRALSLLGCLLLWITTSRTKEV
jgi:hypothetical protein